VNRRKFQFDLIRISGFCVALSNIVLQKFYVLHFASLHFFKDRMKETYCCCQWWS